MSAQWNQELTRIKCTWKEVGFFNDWGFETRRGQCCQMNLQSFILFRLELEENKHRQIGEANVFSVHVARYLLLIRLGCFYSIEVTVSSKPQEEETEGDVGLQLKVSFTDKAVQRNARLAGKWGPSENTLSFFPFAPGEAFKVHFVTQIDTVETAWNLILPPINQTNVEMLLLLILFLFQWLTILMIYSLHCESPSNVICF